MKRVADTEQEFVKMCRSEEEEDEMLVLRTRNTYIIMDEPPPTSVRISVRVDYTGDMLAPIVSLLEGDQNLYNEARRDIMKHLIKKHKILTQGQVYSVYVLI
uniref:ORF77 n=1 Tax=Cydia pomonella granulosis virus TaxID=28289 RepID=A0A097P147_GVCP|nr:ORF77 [Cydia pomonella granulovirus]AIU36860.1 ORF77 [Cydia pomonella granulovirus]WOZ30302.1 hypothetical protein IPEBKFLO_00011 [Cydia pomonella granulovirus]WOZ30427.1 hypothetical protein AGHAAFNI_00013 [Cydia pomonella granulovirus]WOZ30559.1 hypothetical protein KFGOHAPD_00017 [Cydia pomonella granulovirus]